MIPKTIHYCWFGGADLPERDQYCIESWKKYCPDYEIVRWDESNYDVLKNAYMAQAYESRMWGFVPDYARLDIVHSYGGIYLDTDVELLKPFGDMIKDSMFCGFESEHLVAFGLGFGAEKGHPLLSEMMQVYEHAQFLFEDGTMNLLPSPSYQTAVLVEHGLNPNGEDQMIEGVRVYSPCVMSPKSNTTGKIEITDRTVSVHHFHMSWKRVGERRVVRIQQIACQILGEKAGVFTVRLLALPYRVFRKIKDYGAVKTFALIKSKIAKGD